MSNIFSWCLVFLTQFPMALHERCETNETKVYRHMAAFCYGNKTNKEKRVFCLFCFLPVLINSIQPRSSSLSKLLDCHTRVLELA